MLPKYSFLSAAFLGVVFAQNGTVYRDIVGSQSPYGMFWGDEGDEEDHQRFAQANQNPNVTKSFQFTPFYVGGVSNGGSITPDESNEWTLRMNVTDFAVPNAVQGYSEEPPFVNPHITNTVFEMDWPQGGSLKSAINGSTAPFCISITTGSFRPNVTNLITDDNDDGDCGHVLGEECINAIKASGGTSRGCNPGLWEIEPACAATIGASSSYDKYGLSRTTWRVDTNGTGGNATGYEAVANGTDGRYAFWSASTEAYNATNATTYDEEANRLYVMLLSIAPDENSGGPWAQTALCMRANASRLAVEKDSSSNEDGGDGSDGGSGGGESGSSSLMPTAISLVALGWIMYALL